MADIEMIFPEKKLGIKPFNLVNLFVTLMTALIAGGMTLWKVRAACRGEVPANSLLCHIHSTAMHCGSAFLRLNGPHSQRVWRPS